MWAAPTTVPLLELEGLRESAETRYRSVIATTAEALRHRKLGEFRRELLGALEGQSFTWPAFMSWRAYAMKEGWRPLLWEPWMVLPVPSSTVSEQAIARDLRTLLGITAICVATADARRVEVAQLMRERGWAAHRVSAGVGVTPLCSSLAGSTVTREIDLPLLPTYPGCRCTLACP